MIRESLIGNREKQKSHMLFLGNTIHESRFTLRASTPINEIRLLDLYKMDLLTPIAAAARAPVGQRLPSTEVLRSGAGLSSLGPLVFPVPEPCVFLQKEQHLTDRLKKTPCATQQTSKGADDHPPTPLPCFMASFLKTEAVFLNLRIPKDSSG